MKSLSPAIASADLRRVCARFATGVAVATTMTIDGVPHGLTVNSFTSVSAEPPMILVCIGERSNALPHLRAGRYFAVNVLSEVQKAISNRFAGVHEDRFDGIAWTAGMTGSPLPDGAIGQMECEVADIIAAGDHFIVLGHVLRASCQPGAPLLFFDSRYEGIQAG